MTVSIHFCICQALAQPHKRELYQSPVNKIFLAYAVVAGFGDCIWDGSRVGQSLDGPSFRLSSELCLCNSSHGYFVPHSKKEQSSRTLVFLLLEFRVFCKLYLRYSKFLG
ncbi:mCG147410 [Mus musculus]|nr:mCG147410 [Mus musculus]